MEKPKGDKTFGKRMKKLREERNKMKDDKVDVDKNNLPEQSKQEVSKSNKNVPDVTPTLIIEDSKYDGRLKVLQHAILDLSLDVEHILSQMKIL